MLAGVKFCSYTGFAGTWERICTTAVAVAAGRLAGLIAFADQPNPDAQAAVERLHDAQIAVAAAMLLFLIPVDPKRGEPLEGEWITIPALNRLRRTEGPKNVNKNMPFVEFLLSAKCKIQVMISLTSMKKE